MFVQPDQQLILYLISPMVPDKVKNQAFNWVMAKGLGVTVLVVMNVVCLYTINKLWENQRLLQNQMFQLQNSIIKDNTTALSEFNSRTNP